MLAALPSNEDANILKSALALNEVASSRISSNTDRSVGDAGHVAMISLILASLVSSSRSKSAPLWSSPQTTPATEQSTSGSTNDLRAEPARNQIQSPDQARSTADRNRQTSYLVLHPAKVDVAFEITTSDAQIHASGFL